MRGSDINVGSSIRKLRLQQKLTLQELASECDCSKSLLSKIENSIINPSLGSLSQIAKALGVKMSVLLEEEDSHDCVFTAAANLEDKNFFKTDKGYSCFAFAANNVQKEMAPILVRGKAGEVLPHSLVHLGEEFILMLKGKMVFTVGGVEYTMTPGDSIYFNALESHGMMPLTDEIEYLDINLDK